MLFKTDTTIVGFNYMGQVSNNVTFLKSTFYLWLVESRDTECRIPRADYIYILLKAYGLIPHLPSPVVTTVQVTEGKQIFMKMLKGDQ